MIFLVILCIILGLATPVHAEEQKQFHEGSVEWISKCFMVGSDVVLRVTDPDMNRDSELVEEINVTMWSDNDYRNVAYVLTETGKDTGIFDANVFFTTTDSSPGKRLRIVDGSTIYAKYIDYTSSESYQAIDVINSATTGLSVLERNTDGRILKIIYDQCALEILMQNPDWFEQIDVFYPPPLKQIKSGILPIDKIQCKENLVLVEKYDGSPVCVHEQTIPKLIERDWLFDPANSIIKQCAIEYDKIMRIPGCPSSGDGPVCEPKPLIAKFIETSDEIANFKKMHCADNVDEWSHLTEHEEDPNNGQIDWKLVSGIHHENPTFDVYGLNEKFQPIKVGKEITSTIQYWDIVSCFDAETRIIDKLTNEIVFENIYTYECKNKQVGTFDKMMLRITDDVNWKIKLPGFYILELESEKINLVEEFFVECTSGGCEFLTDEQLEGRQKHQGHYD